MTAEAAEIDWLPIASQPESVVDDVRRIRNHPLVPTHIAIYGFIGAANVRYGDIAAYSLLYSEPVFILYAIPVGIVIGIDDPRRTRALIGGNFEGRGSDWTNLDQPQIRRDRREAVLRSRRLP